MRELIQGDLLFYGGIVLMVISAAAAMAAAIGFHVSSKRLKARLEEEYGKKPF